jgi:hypothetical protein
MDHCLIRIGVRAFIVIGFFSACLTIQSNGQENKTSSPSGRLAPNDKDFTLRIGVEEVRLDAVVAILKG